MSEIQYQASLSSKLQAQSFRYILVKVRVLSSVVAHVNVRLKSLCTVHVRIVVQHTVLLLRKRISDIERTRCPSVHASYVTAYV